MSGSFFGNSLKIMTFGESHGKALGAVIDGFPAGVKLSEDDIIPYLERRRPGGAYVSTARNEKDSPTILSGVYKGMTTGTPIAVTIENKDMRSADYSELENVYRPGHADYAYDVKYGIRDHRGGGRSSGRETVSRVIAGAICAKLLKETDIDIYAYTEAISTVNVNPDSFDRDLILKTKTAMPDKEADEKALQLIEKAMSAGDSLGGRVKVVMKNVPAGLGDPVFMKLDAMLAQALMSIGAVKAVEIGDGMNASLSKGSTNNDAYRMDGTDVVKKTNHAGGILGGISDGSDIICTLSFKPTPSVSLPQETVTKTGENTTLQIKGRHDPVIVPRAVVVAECMCDIVILDAMLSNMHSKAGNVISFYKKPGDGL